MRQRTALAIAPRSGFANSRTAGGLLAANWLGHAACANELEK